MEGLRTARRYIGVLFVCSAVALTGCSSKKESSSESEAAGSSESLGAASSSTPSLGAPDPNVGSIQLSEIVSDETAVIQAIFDLVPYGDEGNAVYHRLVETRTRDCMSRAGFVYTEVPFVPRGKVVDAFGLVPPLPTGADLNKRGYGSLSAPQLATPSAEYFSSTSANEAQAQVSEAWSAAYAGDDAGIPGCRGAAVDEVGRAAELRASDLYSALSPSLPIFSAFAAQSEFPSLQTAISDWVLCMNELGFDFVSPDAASESFLPHPDSPPSDNEVRVASADVECRQRSRYQEQLLTAFAEISSTWMSKNEGAVAALNEAKAADLQSLSFLLDN
jgi:hypothetical protein